MINPRPNYAIQIKENDHWKKVVFDYMDDKPIYGAYYNDAACTQFDGPYSAFNKENKVIQKGRYLNNKKPVYGCVIAVLPGFAVNGFVLSSNPGKRHNIYCEFMCVYCGLVTL